MSKICGYAIVNNDVSSDISPKNSKVPVYERIRANALTISPTLFINGHHADALTFFATARDGSLKASWDKHGLRFEATLPETWVGHDVRNALRAGLRLGVSVEMSDMQSETDTDGVREIVAGTLMGISLTRPGFAYYAKAGVWLDNVAPDTLPPDVRALRSKYLTPEPKVAAPKAKAQGQGLHGWYRGSGRVVADGGWYTIIRRSARHSDGLK
jgi:phage head maturation protease